MDLDKMKDAWNKVDFSPQIGEEKILRMLDNKGKSALSRLLLYEKISIILLILLLPAPYIHNYIFKNPELQYGWFSLIWFELICIIGLFWIGYKISILRKFDVAKSDLLTSLKSITKYKKCLQYEIFVATGWVMVFIFSFLTSWTRLIPSHLLLYFIIGISIYLILLILLMYILYRYMYIPKIKKIESSIKEIQEFEDDHDDTAS